MTELGPSIVRDLMRFKPDGITPNAWAVKAGVSRTVWADMRRHGNPSRRTLEKLLTAGGSSLAEFEALRIGASPVSASEGTGAVGEGSRNWRAAPLAPLPLFRCAVAGEWAERGSGIELLELSATAEGAVPRPPSLTSAGDAYALIIAGTSMEPRFRNGARVAVTPSLNPASGDDVLVRLRGNGRVLVKQLVQRTESALQLLQHSPRISFSIDLAGIERIERIAGELI